MLETRILQSEKRSFNASNIEIRVGESQIYICGSLPIRSLSHPITDRKTGKKFRESIEPLCYKIKLLENKAKGYKTKLLKNHSYDHELEYETLEFDEILENELRFEFKLPKTERNLELLEDVSEYNASFSFGFICNKERIERSNEKGIDYIRKIDSFKELKEISILDKWTSPAYDKARGFKAEDYLDAEKKSKKFVLEKGRERQCERGEKKLEQLKEYIVKQKNNQLINQLAGYRKVTKV